MIATGHVILSRVKGRGHTAT